jgi:hypothetical protein
MKQLISLGLLFGVLAIYGAQDFVPIQERAQGQALAGSTQLNDSLYSNPAASSFLNVYSIDGTLAMPKSFAVSVLDTSTSNLGGAIGYFKRSVSSDYFDSGVDAGNLISIQGAKLALMGRLSRTVGIGVSGKSIWGPNTQGKSDHLQDADLGVIYNGAFYQFGGAVRNVFGGKATMDFHREFSIGGRVTYDQLLSLSAATESKFSSPSPYQYGVGVEYVSPFYFALRGGYRTLVTDKQNFWSFGASFTSPKLSIHYAMEIPSQSNAQIEHTLGTTLLF